MLVKLINVHEIPYTGLKIAEGDIMSVTEMKRTGVCVLFDYIDEELGSSSLYIPKSHFEAVDWDIDFLRELPKRFTVTPTQVAGAYEAFVRLKQREAEDESED